MAGRELKEGEYYLVTIENDQDCESPHENEGTWTLYTFNRHKTTYINPDSLGIRWDSNNEFTITNPGLRRKMDVGLAFFVSDTSWGDYVLCEEPRYMNDAGILIWENKPGDMGAKTFEDRKKDAMNDLEQYNAWASGACFGYNVDIVDENGDGRDCVDSYWGFIVANESDEQYLIYSAMQSVPLGAPVRCEHSFYHGTPDWIEDGIRVLSRYEKMAMSREAGQAFDDETPIGIIEDFLKERGLIEEIFQA